MERFLPNHPDFEWTEEFYDIMQNMAIEIPLDKLPFKKYIPIKNCHPTQVRRFFPSYPDIRPRSKSIPHNFKLRLMINENSTKHVRGRIGPDKQVYFSALDIAYILNKINPKEWSVKNETKCSSEVASYVSANNFHGIEMNSLKMILMYYDGLSYILLRILSGFAFVQDEGVHFNITILKWCPCSIVYGTTFPEWFEMYVKKLKQ